MLLASFFPLAVLILAVLGSIVFGLATPTEAAAVGAFGGFLLAIAYRYVGHTRVARRRGASGLARGDDCATLGRSCKESSFLTAKTTRDGVLAVRRLVDLLGGVRAARRSGDHREAGCCRWT